MNYQQVIKAQKQAGYNSIQKQINTGTQWEYFEGENLNSLLKSNQ